MVLTRFLSLTGKAIMMKDVHNFAQKVKPGQRNDVQQLIAEMKKAEGAKVVLFTDSDKTVTSIYFQTKEIIQTFQAQPEILLIDATYKLNDLQMPLYVLLIVDGNGEREIICLWLTQCEDEGTLTYLVDEFKKHNENWLLVRCIMCDKDIMEIDVLVNCLPNAKMLICLFHTLQNMRREISTDKLGISQAERTMCLEVLTKIAYSQDESEYNQLHHQLKQC
uniref:ZSWIM1/3 RNaseH-like domain-containing protein n=1 Tax=Amphimedon queenslandica TaxID=400682 RepID=A0A1X7V8N3_AMPQE